MSVDEKRKNERNYLNNRTNNSRNKKEKRFHKRNKSNYNYQKKNINQKENIITFEDEYNEMSYKNKIQLTNFNNNNLNMIKITSNTVYNSNYDYKKKFKTEICHFWEMNGDCKYGDKCAFAHGESELKNRKMSNNYKTK